MSEAIPIIDISPFLACSRTSGAPLTEQALDVCRQWREAFGRWGFAHVVGHGVPDEHIEECYAAAERFFALPMEDKLSDCA